MDEGEQEQEQVIDAPERGAPTALDEGEVDLPAGELDEHVHDEHVAERQEHEREPGQPHEVPPEALAARGLRSRACRSRWVRVDDAGATNGGHRTIRPMARTGAA